MALRRAGKFVECYLETAGEGSNGTLAYYLATACETIHLAPAGDLNLLGLSSETRFLRGTLDKLKIDPNFNRVGRYKSAVETYTQTQYSPEAQEAIAAVLDGYFAQIVSAVAEARHKSEAEVRALIDGAPWSAEEALGARPGRPAPLSGRVQGPLEKRLGRKPALLPIEDYRPEPAFAGKRVAIVFALGTIVRGGGGTAPWTEEIYLGSDEMARRAPRRLREDDSMAAVVLRIDSPGGSALASDLILREVEKLKREEAGRRLDVRRGGLGRLLHRRQGDQDRRRAGDPDRLDRRLRRQVRHPPASRRRSWGSATTPRSGAPTPTSTPLSSPTRPQQEARVQQLMDHTYQTFVGHVATGRKMSRAGGRGGRRRPGLDRRGGAEDRPGRRARRARPRRRARPPAGPHRRRGDGAASTSTRAAVVARSLRGKREPRLPAALAEVRQALETTPPRLLELPPGARPARRGPSDPAYLIETLKIRLSQIIRRPGRRASEGACGRLAAVL